MEALIHKRCVPCHSETPALSKAQAQEYLGELPGWTLSEDAKAISKQCLMKDFVAAIEFIRRIADVAEAEDHHPDIHLTGYRKLAIVLSTHFIGGLSENDFIVAAKIEQIPKELKISEEKPA